MSQTISLIGVVDDGSEYASETPRFPGGEISIPQGGDISFTITLIYPNGMPVDVSAGSLNFSVGTSAGLPVIVKQGTRVSSALGVFSVVVASGETRALPVRRYIYSAWYTDGAGKRWQAIPLNILRLAPAIW